MNLFALIPVILICGVGLYAIYRFAYKDRCGRCGSQLDYDHHGYYQDYRHCHNCGWCDYCKNV